MKVPILILGIIFLVSISNAFFCYQESANTTNQSGTDGACGLSYNGSYIFSAGWTDAPIGNNQNVTIDGNYSTESFPALAGTVTLNSNYTKPSLANASSVWQIRYMNTSGQTNLVNYSLPATCLSLPFVDVRSQMSFGDVMDFSCWNGSAYQSFYSEDLGVGGGRTRLFEEGMFWQIGCGTINLAGQYDINGNLSAGSCLTIGTSNVNLNCNGNTLESITSGAGNFIITASNLNNLTVRNCKLKWLDSDGAISLLNATTVNVLNNTLLGQFTDLIEVDPAQVSSNLLIANNTMIPADGNRSSRFLWLRNTNNVQVLTNQINPSFGCQQIQGNGNNWSITSNTLITPINFSAGCLPNNSTFVNATLTNSTISYNNVTNFSLFSSTFTTSNITGNRQNGAERSRLDGNGNTLQLNYFQQSNTTLIRVLGSSNLFYNNYFSTNDSNPFLVVGSSNLWNTTLTAGTNILGGANIGGNFYSGYTGHDCDGNGIGDTTYTIAVSDIDYLPITSDQTNCGSGGGGGGAPTPSEPTPTTPEEPTPTVEDQPPRTENPEFYQTPESGYPSQSTTANEIKEALPSLELDILPFKCEAFFTKANIANGEFFDKVGCEYRGVLALYKTGTPLVNGNAIILGASVLLVVLTSKKFDFIFLGSFGIMVFVLVSGFDFLLYSLTAITIIIGGGRV